MTAYRNIVDGVKAATKNEWDFAEKVFTNKYGSARRTTFRKRGESDSGASIEVYFGYDWMHESGFLLMVKYSLRTD
jgi:hypothetical protein